MTNKKSKVLWYDIETELNKVYLFGLGKQVVRHNQLQHGHDRWGIISIQYAEEEGPVKVLRFDKDGGTAAMIQKFDKVVANYDITIGKNSDRFDVKMINTQRMFNEVEAFPKWFACNEDLEKQMRKHFRLPSNSLDYISSSLGFGGKNKMDFNDWVLISQYKECLALRQLLGTKELNGVMQHMFGKKASEVMREGVEATDKMSDYGAKDVETMRDVWRRVEPYIEPRYDSYRHGKHVRCTNVECQSSNVIRRGQKMTASGMKASMQCKECGKYHTRHILKNDNIGAVVR